MRSKFQSSQTFPSLVEPSSIMIYWFTLSSRSPSWYGGRSLHAMGAELAGSRRKTHGRLRRGEASLQSAVRGTVHRRSPRRHCRAHLSLAVAKTWAEWMTAGRGFVAVALVIFSKWHPLRAIAGALLFGGAIALQLQMQARGVPVSPFLLDMLPYLLSLGVLAVWGGARRHAAPASLGQVFRGTE